MFSHVFIGSADFERALAFYEALMSLLGIAQRFCDRTRPWAAGRCPAGASAVPVGAPFEGEHAAGAPGLRPHYHADYYGAYFRDPDGNQLCVVCHEGM